MILDRLEHASRYEGLGPAFRKAFAWLAETRFEGLPDGRQEVDGERVYALLSSYTTAAADSKKLEAHRRYADIQVVLEGEEVLYWAPLEGLRSEVAYQPEKDVEFFAEPAASSSALHLRPGLFGLFLAQDAHKPGCHLGGATAVRKLVVKVQL